MDRTVAALTRHYPRRDEVAQQALSVLNHYHTLVNAEQSDFTYDDGRVELLLSLTGVLPVPIGANTYHCPVAIWLPLDFPSRPPIVYVLASETLQIRKGKHVDANGKVEAPYLENWGRKSEGCSLMSLINELIPIFSARYPLSPVQAKPKPQPSSSGTSAAPARPPLPNAQSQAVPPRPAPPLSVAPAGSQAPVAGPPPRPPLPGHSATMGPRPPSRPQSMSFEPPTRSMTTAPDGRSGSPAAPPRPPPPRSDTNGAGLPPMGRPLPGSFAPPPAYPAQPPLAPPIPPPQRIDPPSAMSALLASYSHPHPPPPPAYPAGFQPPGQAPYPAQSGAVPRQATGTDTGVAYGEAGGAFGSPRVASHQAHERAGSPSQSTVRSVSPQHTSQARHAYEQQDTTRPHSAYHERQGSLGLAQASHRANGYPADPRYGEPRTHSPAPSVAASTMSHPSAGTEALPHSYGQPAYVDPCRGPPTSPPQPHPASGPATSRPTPPSAHLPSARPPHLMYDRAQTHSPAPLSEVGSYASSQMRMSADRSYGPRPPAPPSEYSGVSEYAPYGQGPAAPGPSEPSRSYPASPPHSPPGRAPPTRSMTVSYEARDPSRSYGDRVSDLAFEPIVEPRTAPAPPQEPVHTQAPSSRQSSMHSDYTATTSAFVPRQQQYEPTPDAAYARERGLAMSPSGPSSHASYVSTSHATPPSAISSDASKRPTNGFAPPIPVVAPLPAAQRAIRKSRPASTAAKPVNILDAADDDLESSAPSSPSTVTDPRAPRTVAAADSVSQAGASASAAFSVRAPPVPPNPALLALRTRVHSKLSGAMAELAHSTEAELARLDMMRVDLEKAQPAIEDEMARLEAVRSVCGGVRDRYAQVVAEAQQRMREYEARGEGVDVDEIICGSTVVYTQLLDLVAEDAALEDTIYALGRGLNSDGVANIDLDQFLKRVRLLAKEQFVIRATINKILNGLALRRQGRESQQALGRGATPVMGGGGGGDSGSGGRGTPTPVA